MNFIVWVIFGGIAGWIASLIMGNKKQGCLINIIVGVLGAFIGGFIMKFITGDVFSFSFSLKSFGVAVIGSLVLLILVGIGRKGK
ncbi:GlsB/YeaQ/YmgE family stress response membrane protein [candidate division WOR-3 bacterium]|nr:GlsB/YeaQ/YmgE family stress response membrane protein [candidate division WOR-3 bacterium]